MQSVSLVQEFARAPLSRLEGKQLYSPSIDEHLRAGPQDPSSSVHLTAQPQNHSQASAKGKKKGRKRDDSLPKAPENCFFGPGEEVGASEPFVHFSHKVSVMTPEEECYDLVVSIWNRIVLRTILNRRALLTEIESFGGAENLHVATLSEVLIPLNRRLK